jgi:hypothetical protein
MSRPPISPFSAINPWFEEAFWRGLLLDHTRQSPVWVRILYSSALFAVSYPIIWGVYSRGNRLRFLPRAWRSAVGMSHYTQAVTSHRGGVRPLRRGQLALADRGYSNPPGIVSVVERDADVLVRVNRSSLPMYTRDGERQPLMVWLSKTSR